PFLRYFMVIGPIGAFLTAWTLVRGTEWLWPATSRSVETLVPSDVRHGEQENSEPSLASGHVPERGCPHPPFSNRIVMPRTAAAVACALALFLAISPLVSKPVVLLVPRELRMKTGTVVRAELPRLFSEVFGNDPDPNRLVIEWLKAHAQPTDEILINY